MFWKEPQLPPVEKMPQKREGKRAPNMVGRALAGVAGLALGVTGTVGLVRALGDTTGRASPLMSLAMILPTVLLIRYALTGQIKLPGQ